jgi:ferritin
MPLFTDFAGTERLKAYREATGRPDVRWCTLPSPDGSGGTITYDLDVDSTNKIIAFAEEHQSRHIRQLLPAQIPQLGKMGDFLVDRGGTVKLQMIDVVPEGWGSPLEVFEHTYSHECKVSKMIDGIVTLAIAEKDYATENFFRTFVDEQVEEEATASGIVDKLRKVGDTGVFFIDSQLGKR